MKAILFSALLLPFVAYAADAPAPVDATTQPTDPFAGMSAATDPILAQNLRKDVFDQQLANGLTPEQACVVMRRYFTASCTVKGNEAVYIEETTPGVIKYYYVLPIPETVTPDIPTQNPGGASEA